MIVQRLSMLSDRGMTPRLWRILFVTALTIVLAFAAARYAAKIQKASVLGTQTRSAFLRWRAQIVGDTWPDGRPVLGLKQGADPYLLYNYPNPPIMALVLWPFFELPPVAGALTWFVFKVVMAALAVLWAFRLASTPGQSWPTLAWSAAVLLGLHPILGDLSHGNVNIFIAFLVMGGWELFRRRQDTASGFLFGLAVACKVTPALLFPYLVWKRAWRAAAAMLISVAVWLCVVPGAVFGWERNTTLLTHWFDGMVRPFLIDGKITSEHANQSIPGVVARLLTSQPSDWDYDEDGKPVPVSFHTIVDLGSDGAKRVVRACQVLFALAVVTLCWAPIGPGAIRQGPRFAAEVSLILLGMLLFSERTWKHHAVTLILPYAVMAGVIASGAVAPVWRRYLTGTCLVTAVCTFGPSLIGGDMQDLALVYGSQTVVFLLLAVAMGVVMHHVDSSGGTNRTDHHQAAA